MIVIPDPSLLNNMGRVVGDALNGGHGLAGCRRYGNAARANRLTIEVQGAGAALGNATAEFGSGHPEMIADDPEERRVF